MSDGGVPPLSVGDLGKPATKFIECVAGAVGTVYEPTRIVELAKANAEAARIKALSDKEILVIESQTELARATMRSEIDQLRAKSEAAVKLTAAENEKGTERNGTKRAIKGGV